MPFRLTPAGASRARRTASATPPSKAHRGRAAPRGPSAQAVERRERKLRSAVNGAIRGPRSPVVTARSHSASPARRASWPADERRAARGVPGHEDHPGGARDVERRPVAERSDLPEVGGAARRGARPTTGTRGRDGIRTGPFRRVRDLAAGEGRVGSWTRPASRARDGRVRRTRCGRCARGSARSPGRRPACDPWRPARRGAGPQARDARVDDRDLAGLLDEVAVDEVRCRGDGARGRCHAGRSGSFRWWRPRRCRRWLRGLRVTATLPSHHRYCQ